MAQIRNTAGAAAFFLLAILPALWLSQPACAEAPARSRFSRPEINWATTWINNALPQFMHKGIITKISNKNDNFELFAGPPWRGLSFSQQGEFLKNLARAREITGHPPYFSVVDSATSETLARVSGAMIEILTPGEGFKLYVPPQDAYQPAPQP